MGRGSNSPTATEAGALAPARRRRARSRPGVSTTRIVLADGTVEYRRGDLLHCDDGPARVRPDGTLEWFRNGFPFRLDAGPTVEYADGTRVWLSARGPDRDDGPAIAHPDGGVEYFQQGERHRGGGLPAVERADGSVEYWESGRRHRDPRVGPALIDRCTGERAYYREGELHREDGPAVITAKGVGLFYRDGMACPPPIALAPFDL